MLPAACSIRSKTDRFRTGAAGSAAITEMFARRVSYEDVCGVVELVERAAANY